MEEEVKALVAAQEMDVDKLASRDTFPPLPGTAASAFSRQPETAAAVTLRLSWHLLHVLTTDQARHCWGEPVVRRLARS